MDCPIAHLELSADFSDMKDIVVFRYWSHGEWKRLGSVHKLYFKLDHFTGCRVGLFCYASEQTGELQCFMILHCRIYVLTTDTSLSIISSLTLK